MVPEPRSRHSSVSTVTLSSVMASAGLWKSSASGRMAARSASGMPFSAAMALASSTGIRRLRRIHGWVWTSRLLGLPKWTRVFSTTSVTISPRTAWPFSTVGSNHVYRQPSPSTAALRRNSRTSPTT